MVPVLVTLVSLLLLRVFCRVSIGVLELAVPDLLDLLDLVGAEAEPALHLGSLLDVFIRFIFILAAVLVVESVLRNVAQLKRDLADLAQVEARSHISRRKVEVGVRLQLLHHEVFHRLQVFFVKRLAEVV